MHKPTKPVPHFESEAEERAFWESHDSADYVDWSKAERVRMPNLKPGFSVEVEQPDGDAMVAKSPRF